MGGTKSRKQKTRYKVTQYILFKKGQKKMIDSVGEVEMELSVKTNKSKEDTK